MPPTLVALLHAAALAPGARVVVEHASRDPAPAIPGLTPRPSRAYGDTTVTVYERDEPALTPA